MPLSPGRSDATISQNIREMRHAGHPQDQAVAAALNEARRTKRAMGGPAEKIKRMAHPASLIPGIHVRSYAEGGDVEGKKPQSEQEPHPGFEAYHGSPHSFDKFDMSKIGTGEGAQAYGHGLYFAEKEGTAADYRRKLAWAGKYPDDILSLPPEMRQAITTHAANDTDAATAAKRAQYMSPLLRNVSHDKVVDMVERARAAKSGHLYHVHIAANPDHFLDWDKPLSEQHPKVQEAFANAGLPTEPSYSTRTAFGRETMEARLPGGAQATIQNFKDADPSRKWVVNLGSHDPYQYFGSKEDALNAVKQRYQTEFMLGSSNLKGEEVSSKLREQGIPGIKYLDQGSRNPFNEVKILSPKETSHGQWLVKELPNGKVHYRGDDEAAARQAYKENYKAPSRNYVVFDHNLVHIKRKYAEGGNVRELNQIPQFGGHHPHKLHTGPIHSAVAGRTDHLPTHVPSGSYVLPADIVSGLGEGNTQAGFKHLKRMFAELKRRYGGLPYSGDSAPYGQHGGPYGGHARGGSTQGVPVVLAGGEHVLSPQEVAHAGEGDMDAGHKALDEFVKRFRAKTVKTLKGLPGPRND